MNGLTPRDVEVELFKLHRMSRRFQSVRSKFDNATELRNASVAPGEDAAASPRFSRLHARVVRLGHLLNRAGVVLAERINRCRQRINSLAMGPDPHQPWRAELRQKLSPVLNELTDVISQTRPIVPDVGGATHREILLALRRYDNEIRQWGRFVSDIAALSRDEAIRIALARFPTITDALVHLHSRSPALAEDGSSSVNAAFALAIWWVHSRCSWTSTRNGGELWDYVSQLSHQEVIDPVIREAVVPQLRDLDNEATRRALWSAVIDRCPRVGVELIDHGSLPESGESLRDDLLRYLSYHEEVPIVGLQRRLLDPVLLSVMDADGLIEFGRRNHCWVNWKLVVEDGWDFVSLTGPGKRPLSDYIQEALHFEGDIRVAPHMRLTSRGRIEANRLILAASANTPAGWRPHDADEEARAETISAVRHVLGDWDGRNWTAVRIALETAGHFRTDIEAMSEEDVRLYFIIPRMKFKTDLGGVIETKTGRIVSEQAVVASRSGRLTDEETKDRENRIRQYIQNHQSEGRPIEELSRDGIAKACHVPASFVSGTQAWKAIAAQKRQQKRPRTSRPVGEAVDLAMADHNTMNNEYDDLLAEAEKTGDWSRAEKIAEKLMKDP